MKAFSWSLFSVLVCFWIVVSANAQTRALGAHELVLDDGTGHTLTIQTSTMSTDQIFTFPAVTSYSPGSVLFADGSGAINQNNPLFFWDNTHNRLGIGNAIPAYPLDVTGAINTSTVYSIGGSTVLSNAGTNNLFAGVNTGTTNTGSNNTFVGYAAGKLNTSGFNGTFVGLNAGFNNTGGDNTFVGLNAGWYNSSGADNAFFGLNTGFGNSSGVHNTTESNITLLGFQADIGLAGITNATALGNAAVVAASNSVQLGNGGVTLVQSHGSFNSTAGGFETNGTTRINNSGNATLGTLSATGTTNINTSGGAATAIATGGTGTLALGNATGNTVVTGTISDPGAGANSERFGAGSAAAGVNSLAVGNSASASNLNSIAIGTGATAAGGDGVAIGFDASAPNFYSVAIGPQATGGPSFSVQLGDVNMTLVQSQGSFNSTGGGFQTNGTTRIDNSGNGTLNQVTVGGGTPVLKVLSATGSLTFTATAPQSNNDQTIALAGANVGDAVMLGVPNGAVLSNSSYSAWVSAANTVTVRFNNYSSGSQTPAAAQTFRVAVVQF